MFKLNSSEIKAISILMILCCCSCRGKKDADIKPTRNPEQIISINIDTLDVGKSILASDVFNKIEIIPLETREEFLIGKINQLEIYKGKIYVLDSHISKGLFAFDRKGRFISKIGQLGRGPGEFSRPDMFTIDKTKGTILVLDNNSNKILEYKLNGEFVKDIKLENAYITNQIAHQGQNIYIDNLPRKGAEAEYWLYSINPEGKIEHKWFSVDKYNKGFVKLLTISSNFFQAEDELKYVKPFFDTIFVIKDNNAYPFIALSSKNSMTNVDIEKLNNSTNPQKLAINFIELKKFHGISRYFENKKMAYFEFRNNRLYHKLFYYFSNGRIMCTTELVDDFTNTVPMQKFMGTYDNHFLSVLQDQSLIDFISNCNENKVVLSNSDAQAVKKLSELSNPVVVLYNCK